MIKTYILVLTLMICFSAFSNTNINDCSIKIDTINSTYCNTSLKGQIEINAIGGKPPYLYKINNGNFSNKNIFYNISSNNYDITIKDNNGCEVTVYKYVEIPKPIHLSYTLNNKVLSINVNKTGQYKYSYNDGNWSDTSIFKNVIDLNKITIKTEYGCEIERTIINQTKTNTTTFKLYPNPALDYVFIKGTNKLKHINILNQLGKVLLTHDTNKTVINLNISILKPGIYLIKVTDINNRQEVKKLLVN